MLSLLDLFEAEGRAFRRSAAKLGISLMLLTVVGLLLAVGFGFCLWAGYQWLAALWGGALAALVMGVVSLALAGFTGWLAWRNVR